MNGVSSMTNFMKGRKDFHTIMVGEVEQRLLARLAYFKINPQVVLDLGLVTCGRLLKKRYPKAYVLRIDPSKTAALVAHKAQHFWARDNLVVSDVLALPVADASVDLIVSNQLLAEMVDFKLFFQECQRVLKPNGCLLFSTLGPDTYKELRGLTEVRTYPDLHDLGDALMKTNFSDPVMDREDLILQSSSLSVLQSAFSVGDLQVQDDLWQAYSQVEGKFPVTYELIYGLAWRKDKPSQQVISLQSLQQTLQGLR